LKRLRAREPWPANWKRKRGNTLLWIPSIGAVILTALTILPLPGRVQDQMHEYLGRFQRETNAVHRAKLMKDLGNAEFEEMEKDVSAGNLSAALTLLRTYRDQAQTCSKGLDDHQQDAERHPAGFKELQISLRESLRRLDTMMADMTRDDQTPFRDVRKDLDQLNRHVIEELFPRQPPGGNAPAKPND
jgi:hypothetical protein